jgi:cytochrome c oxidase subunit 2
MLGSPTPKQQVDRGREPARRGRGPVVQGAMLAALAGVAAFGFTLADGRAQTSVLDPAGPRAERISTLWWVMFALGTAVFVIVLALLVIALLRGRRRASDPSPADNGTRPILVGVLISAVIMIGLFAYTLMTQRSLAEPAQGDVLIEVVGNQWWWDVRYPDADVRTANEVHIPVGVPVTVRLTTEDVIHSFWVPRLSEKMDLIPGRANDLTFQADEPGTYLGLCAEFCGLQHAWMQFRVIAVPEQEFTAWLDEQRAPAAEPVPNSIVQEGQQLFLGSACVYCHTVRGTNASGTLGPDLTHLASRQTLGAGVLENNLANLSAWIIDPQGVKPGNLMPSTNLSAEELQAVVAYLRSLD